MAQRKVKVVLNTDTCEFSVDLTGFQGKGCADVSRMFENLGQVTKSQKKPEFKQETINLIRK